MGLVEGLRSEMKNFEDPRGMRVYALLFDINVTDECHVIRKRIC